MSNSYQWARSLKGVLQTRYPPFLFGLPLNQYEIPVFIYHDVEPIRFAEDLEFLQENGYRAISLDEFIKSTLRKEPAKKRVLLTFDDARRTFYTEGLPLLRQFNSHATLFVPTYWVGHVSNLFMTWSEIFHALQSDYVDIQSHAHRHALVAITDRLLGFATPQALARYDIYDWPMRHYAGSDDLGLPPLGYPIYAARPLFSASTRYLESNEVVAACLALVDQQGGERFFRRRDALQELRRLHRTRSKTIRVNHADSTALRQLVGSEFELCRAAFERHLGFAPTSFAYPWAVGSLLSLNFAKDFGLRAVFGAAQDFRKTHDSNLPLPVFGRLRADWLRLLPGKGRARFVSLACNKLAGFSKAQHLAH